MVCNVIAKNLTHSYQSYNGLRHGKKRNEDYEHEEEKARMTARCGVCAPPPLPSPPFPPVSSLPSPPKESSLPPSAGSAGFCFYITCTHAGSWAAWGGRGGTWGDPRGRGGSPPFAHRQAPLRRRPPRSARDGAAPGAASARPGGGGGNTAPSGPLRKG